MIPIPHSHLDLLQRPIHAVLTTMMPDGQPQCSLVWCDYDGQVVRVNTTRERQKGKNMQANPKATLLIIDPNDTTRFIEIRSHVEITEEGALAHLDELTQHYTNKQHYYGQIFPAEQKQKETRIICKFKPVKITLDAIHR